MIWARLTPSCSMTEQDILIVFIVFVFSFCVFVLIHCADSSCLALHSLVNVYSIFSEIPTHALRQHHDRPLSDHLNETIKNEQSKRTIHNEQSTFCEYIRVQLRHYLLPAYANKSLFGFHEIEFMAKLH